MCVVRSSLYGKLPKPIAPKPVAEEQHDFLQHLFYQGAEVGESCRLLQESILELSANVDRITLLDLYCGLGPVSTNDLVESKRVQESLHVLRV